jgi:hypothetical protein
MTAALPSVARMTTDHGRTAVGPMTNTPRRIRAPAGIRAITHGGTDRPAKLRLPARSRKGGSPSSATEMGWMSTRSESAKPAPRKNAAQAHDQGRMAPLRSLRASRPTSAHATPIKLKRTTNKVSES